MKGSLKVQSDSTAKSNQPKYKTGTTGVQENPNAPDNKEMHVIDPPEHSTQHF